MVCSNPIVQVIRHDAILGVKQVLAREHLSHAHFGHATLIVVWQGMVSHTKRSPTSPTSFRDLPAMSSVLYLCEGMVRWVWFPIA